MLDVHWVLKFLFTTANIDITREAVSRFWSQARACKEPWALHTDASPDHVPLALFGDGATFQTRVSQESIIGIFLSLPLWRPRSARCSRFLLCAIPTKRVCTPWTLNAIYRRVVWGCNAAFENVHPTLDQNGNELPAHLKAVAGQPICDRRFAVTEIRGDWSWHKESFQLTSAWNAMDTCHFCSAKLRGSWGEVYYNIEGAEWEEEEISLSTFLSRKLPDTGICDLGSFYIVHASNSKHEVQTCGNLRPARSSPWIPPYTAALVQYAHV